MPANARCCSTAPMRRPPFEPPRIASLELDVYFCAIRYSAAAIKSSKIFCFWSFVPARCQESPYSPPPRMFASAKMPPRSSHVTADGEIYGG